MDGRTIIRIVAGALFVIVLVSSSSVAARVSSSQIGSTPAGPKKYPSSVG